MSDSSYASLPQLPEFHFPVYASTSVHPHARVLAQRFDRAYTYLTTRLQIALDIRLALLSQQDWPDYVQLPIYGVTLYDYSQRTVVSGAEPASFWKPILAKLQTAAPALLERLRLIYTAPDGTLDLTLHVELWMIHDLGHACHFHHDYRFPRKWLMELFASLCMYTYIAGQEPDLLPLAETFLLVMHDLPAEVVDYPRLAEFETRYTKLPLETYLWFSGHFMQLAHDLYAQFGNAAFERMWQIFVLGKLAADVSDEELKQQMIRTDPALAELLIAFPEQYA